MNSKIEHNFAKKYLICFLRKDGNIILLNNNWCMSQTHLFWQPKKYKIKYLTIYLHITITTITPISPQGDGSYHISSILTRKSAEVIYLLIGFKKLNIVKTRFWSRINNVDLYCISFLLHFHTTDSGQSNSTTSNLTTKKITIKAKVFKK